MEVDAFEKMRSVKREHIRVHLRRLHAAMTEKLTHKFQRPPVQQKVHRKAVPKGVASDLERRLSPHLIDQPIDVRTDRLARDRKDPLVLPKLPHPQIALDPGLEVPI